MTSKSSVHETYATLQEMFYLGLTFLTGLANAKCDLSSLSVTCRPSQMQVNIVECPANLNFTIYAENGENSCELALESAGNDTMAFTVDTNQPCVEQNGTGCSEQLLVPLSAWHYRLITTL